MEHLSWSEVGFKSEVVLYSYDVETREQSLEMVSRTIENSRDAKKEDGVPLYEFTGLYGIPTTGSMPVNLGHWNSPLVEVFQTNEDGTRTNVDWFFDFDDQPPQNPKSNTEENQG